MREIKFRAWLKNKEEIKLYSKEILTDKERHYLSIVTKPFKNKVKTVIKFNTKNDDYIQIDLINGKTFTLPCFETGTLYKGMEYNKKYYPSELKI